MEKRDVVIAATSFTLGVVVTAGVDSLIYNRKTYDLREWQVVSKNSFQRLVNAFNDKTSDEFTDILEEELGFVAQIFNTRFTE